jgi:ATP phosphoribosyltransferase regulatory subunit
VSENDELLAARGVSEEQRRMLRVLAQLSGGVEVLDEANRELARAPESVQAAMRALWSIATSLQRRLPEVALHFDLGELRGYAYHTGAVFAAFVPGHGEEVARGGRYDQIGRVFGRSRPATGFSADLKTLMALGGQPGAAAHGGVQAPWGDDAALLEAVRRLREAGERVVWLLPGQTGADGCDRQLVERAGQWTVEPLQS